MIAAWRFTYLAPSGLAVWNGFGLLTQAVGLGCDSSPLWGSKVKPTVAVIGRVFGARKSKLQSSCDVCDLLAIGLGSTGAPGAALRGPWSRTCQTAACATRERHDEHLAPSVARMRQKHGFPKSRRPERHVCATLAPSRGSAHPGSPSQAQRSRLVSVTNERPGLGCPSRLLRS